MVAWEFRNCQTFVCLGDPLLLIECSDVTRIIARRLFTLVQRKSLLRLIFFILLTATISVCHFTSRLKNSSSFAHSLSGAGELRSASFFDLCLKIFCRLFVSSAFERRFTYTLSMHLRTFSVTQPSRFHLNTAFDLFFLGIPVFSPVTLPLTRFHVSPVPWMSKKLWRSYFIFKLVSSFLWQLEIASKAERQLCVSEFE